MEQLTYALTLANAIRADLDQYVDSPADFTPEYMESVLTAAEELQDTLELMLTKEKK